MTQSFHLNDAICDCHIRMFVKEHLDIAQDEDPIVAKESLWKEACEELLRLLSGPRKDLAECAYAIGDQLLSLTLSPTGIPLHMPEHVVAYKLIQAAAENSEWAPEPLFKTVLKAAIDQPKEMDVTFGAHGEAQDCAIAMMKGHLYWSLLATDRVVKAFKTPWFEKLTGPSENTLLRQCNALSFTAKASPILSDGSLTFMQQRLTKARKKNVRVGNELNELNISLCKEQEEARLDEKWKKAEALKKEQHDVASQLGLALAFQERSGETLEVLDHEQRTRAERKAALRVAEAAKLIA